jgi:osmotically-inducible protein OsmY
MMGRLLTVALATTLSASGCAYITGHCEDPECADDARIRAQVSEQINARPSLRFFNIDIQTWHHNVYLRGLVDTEIDRDSAQRIALAVPGVKRVYNDLMINGSRLF